MTEQQPAHTVQADFGGDDTVSVPVVSETPSEAAAFSLPLSQNTEIDEYRAMLQSREKMTKGQHEEIGQLIASKCMAAIVSARQKRVIVEQKRTEFERAIEDAAAAEVSATAMADLCKQWVDRAPMPYLRDPTLRWKDTDENVV